jgi:hypothetical protein
MNFRFRPASRRDDLVHEVLPPARDDDVVASVRKSLCQPAPDSGRRARDEDGVAREVQASSRPERTTTLPD